MGAIKTKPTTQCVKQFINSIPDEQKRKDRYTIIKIMTGITGEKPKMWVSSIIGLGNYLYKYESGHKDVMCVASFSPPNHAFSFTYFPDLKNIKTNVETR